MHAKILRKLMCVFDLLVFSNANIPLPAHPDALEVWFTEQLGSEAFWCLVCPS